MDSSRKSRKIVSNNLDITPEILAVISLEIPLAKIRSETPSEIHSEILSGTFPFVNFSKKISKIFFMHTP